MYLLKIACTNIRIRRMFICIEIPKYWRLSLFRYEMFVNFFWLLVFRHEERETQFFLCWLFLNRPSVDSLAELVVPKSNLNSLTQQIRGASRSPRWTGLAQVRISINCFFSEIPKIQSPSLPGMSSFTPQSHLPSCVFIMTFVIFTSSAHERELHSNTHLPVH